MNNEYLLALPLISISVFSLLCVLLDSLLKKPLLNFLLSITGLIITAGAAVFTIIFPNTLNSSELTITRNSLTFGGLPAVFDVIFCVSALLSLTASRDYLRREYKEHSELYYLMLFAVTGMMLLAHSNNFIVFFIGIELMSITFYILAGFFRKSILSIEAGLKYFFLGAFATGFLLYGFSFLYGATGHIEFSDSYEHLMSGKYTFLFFNIGLGLVVTGLCFKVAAFPFHQWAPDVYYGAPTNITAFMSTAGKAAAFMGFLVIAKLIYPTVPNPIFIKNNPIAIQWILAFISAITMLIGNFTALVQKNVKRMLAYSSVAHAGYLLMGLVSYNYGGKSAVVFYIIAYLFMQIGAFLIVSVLENKDEEYLELDYYSGLSKTNPVLAAIMSIFMLSLAGLPPFAGFFGKYYLFVSTIKSQFTWLTIVAVISSIISMYYYIGLILKMYFYEPNKEGSKAQVGLASISLTVSVLAIIILGIFPSLVIWITENLY